MMKFTVLIGGRRSRFALEFTLMVASLLLAGATATMQAQNATPQSVSPSSGSGAEQAFTVTVTDPNSGTDVHNVALNIVNGVVPGSQAGWSAHICSLNYTLSTGVIQLAQDAGGTYLSTTATSGTTQTVGNSQCTVFGVASSATSSATSTTVTVTFFVSFMPAFSGAKQLYAVAVDNEGNNSTNFQTELGTYDATASVTPVSVSPSAGSGAEQMFTATYTDATAIQKSFLTFNSAANLSSDVNQCALRYDPPTNNIFLSNNAGSSFGSPITAGSTATLSNSQCTVLASLSSGSISGNTLTVKYFVTFTAAYAGVKQIEMGGTDVNGNTTFSDTSYGTFTDTATVFTVSVSPPSGAGAEQLFTAAYSDATAQIQSAFLNFKTSGNSSSSANECGLRYDPGTADIFLINDAGTSYGSPIPSGSTTPLSNSQCTVYGVGTGPSSTTGNTVKFNFNVSFAPGFDGLKQMTMGGVDVNGNSTFSNLASGSWLVGALTSGPACAASASGAGQIICVVSGTTGELFAVWQNEHPTTPATTPATVANTAISYLDLGVTGAVGSSSCSSTADGTGDTVCAYTSNSALYGMRFNVGDDVYTHTPQSAPVTQSLSISSVTGNASCAIGAARFTPPLERVSPEPLGDDTICAVRSTNGELMAVAFNPKVQINLTAVLDLGFPATSDPSCTNPNIVFNPNPSNLVTCVANTANGLKEATFDPRPQNGNTIASSPSTQILYSGTSFLGSPGCSAPSDATGDVICAVSNSSNNLVGFAFNPQLPSTSLVPSSSPLVLSTTAVIGNPSCAGFGNPPNFGNTPPTISDDANSRQVLCAVRVASTNLINGVEFDPRQSPVKNSGLISTNASQVFPTNPSSLCK